jgi:hypothetical protein
MQGGHLYAGEFSHNICDWFYVGRSDIIKKFTSQLHSQVSNKFKNGIKHMRDYNRHLCEENNIKVELVDFGALIHKRKVLSEKKQEQVEHEITSDDQSLQEEKSKPSIEQLRLESKELKEQIQLKNNYLKLAIDKISDIIWNINSVRTVKQ